MLLRFRRKTRGLLLLMLLLTLLLLLTDARLPRHTSPESPAANTDALRSERLWAGEFVIERGLKRSSSILILGFSWGGGVLLYVVRVFCLVPGILISTFYVSVQGSGEGGSLTRVVF